jgi:hypothetical protein
MAKDYSRNPIAKCFVLSILCVNDNKEVNLTTPQVMCCILCHDSLILNLNPKTQARKRLIIYNTINGITTLKKHVNSNNCHVFLKIEKVNNPLKEKGRQPFIKKPNMSSNSISNIFATNESFFINDLHQKKFLENLNLLIVKNHLLL